MILNNTKIYFAGYNLSGDSNSTDLQLGYEEKDDTTFGDTARSVACGMQAISGAVSGFWDAGTGGIDGNLWGKLNTASQVLSVSPVGTIGSSVYACKSMHMQYNFGGQIGDLLPFSAAFRGQGVASVKGTILEISQKTLTGNGTGRQLTDVDAGQYLYGGMHIVAVTGTNPTLDVIIQSDNAITFDTPTTRLTFTQASAVGAQWLTPVAGAIADDYWRASYTIGGTDTPTFTVLIWMAIQ